MPKQKKMKESNIKKLIDLRGNLRRFLGNIPKKIVIKKLLQLFMAVFGTKNMLYRT